MELLLEDSYVIDGLITTLNTKILNQDQVSDMMDQQEVVEDLEDLDNTEEGCNTFWGRLCFWCCRNCKKYRSLPNVEGRINEMNLPLLS